MNFRLAKKRALNCTRLERNRTLLKCFLARKVSLIIVTFLRRFTGSMVHGFITAWRHFRHGVGGSLIFVHFLASSSVFLFLSSSLFFFPLSLFYLQTALTDCLHFLGGRTSDFCVGGERCCCVCVCVALPL